MNEYPRIPLLPRPGHGLSMHDLVIGGLRAYWAGIDFEETQLLEARPEAEAMLLVLQDGVLRRVSFADAVPPSAYVERLVVSFAGTLEGAIDAGNAYRLERRIPGVEGRDCTIRGLTAIGGADFWGDGGTPATIVSVSNGAWDQQGGAGIEKATLELPFNQVRSARVAAQIELVDDYLYLFVEQGAGHAGLQLMIDLEVE